METSDPMVAVLYGALAYPSQRPSLTTAVDLVAGQPGPWILDDEDRALLAASLVARSRAARPVDAAEGVLAQAVAGTVVEVLNEARRQLADAWSEIRDRVPAHVAHDIEQLEERLISFTDTYADGFPHRTAPAPGGLPSLEEATRLRHDQWMVLIQERNLSVPKALGMLRTRVEAAGKVPPRNLREAAGQTFAVEQLLDVLTELAQEAA